MAVLITGASGGLGASVVEQFLNAGAEVTGVARSLSEGHVKAPRLRWIAADLTQVAECGRVATEAGPVDVLVHLMGGFAGGKPVQATDDETWDRMMNLNLRSAFYMIRAVLPGMIERKRGRILAVGSRTGAQPAATLSAYGASKAALTSLIQAVALESKENGITANVILPSVIDTPVNRAAMPSMDHSKWVRPESIAKLLVWLASEDASDVNGAAIPIYGRA
ncbi:MAG: SDR family oxidoreductase [Bryobacteraceae bacterium]